MSVLDQVTQRGASITRRVVSHTGVSCTAVDSRGPIADGVASQWPHLGVVYEAYLLKYEDTYVFVRKLKTL